MSNNPLQSRQTSEPMEIETTGVQLPSQNTNSRLDELRIRREKTSENRLTSNELSNLEDDGFGNMNQVLCPFCENPTLINMYNQHITECQRRPNTRLSNRISNDPLNIELSQESQNNQMEPDSNENQLQVATPFNRTAARRPGRRFNIIRNVAQNPTTLPTQDLPRNDFPLFPTMTEDFSLPPIHAHQTIPNAIEQEHQEPQEPVAEEHPNPNMNFGQIEPQPNHENPLGQFPHGAVIIRTVQTGPNGSTMIRVRIIPMNELFGNPGGNEQPEGLGLFGALLGMLSGGNQGGRFFNITSLFDLFHEERGLEKEVLDSLPVVIYNQEMFKNVDEESKRCSICLDNFEDGNEVRYLWCIHRFHKNCVDQWLDKHTNCPNCKKDYSELEKTTFE